MQRLSMLCVVLGFAVLAACSSSSGQTSAPATTAPAPTLQPVSSASSPSAVAAAASPSPATATPLPPPTVPSPTPAPALTTTPAALQTVWVANTQGGGVFLRNSPHDGDRADVLPENTPLTVTGEMVEGDGQKWLPVRTQDNKEGYVPQPYTTTTDPKAAPAPLVAGQAK